MREKTGNKFLKFKRIIWTKIWYIITTFRFVYMPACFGLPWNILIKTEIFSKIFSCCAFNVTTCGIVWNVFHQKTAQFPCFIFLFFEGSEKWLSWSRWLPRAEQTNKDISLNRQVVVSGPSNLYLYLKTQNYHLDTDWLVLCWWFNEGRYGWCCGGNIIK